MTRSARLSVITDSVWLPAVLAGVAVMPFSIGFYRYAPFLTSIPVFAVGICVGYYYRHRSKRAIRVGTRTGIVGGVLSLWEYSTALELLTSEIGSGQSVVTTAMEIAPPLLVLLLAVGAATLQGFLGTLVGVRTVRKRPLSAST